MTLTIDKNKILPSVSTSKVKLTAKKRYLPGKDTEEAIMRLNFVKCQSCIHKWPSVGTPEKAFQERIPR